jgi:putative glutamine amidotransferase
MPAKTNSRPRIGIPWVSSAAEKTGKRRAFERYIRAVREAGGEPVEVSLLLPNDELKRLTESLDGMVLPGSGSDVDTRRYDQRRHEKTAEPDFKREHTDDFLLDYAFAAHKPVLAICYGAQILNVHQHGALVQDIPSEIGTPMGHDQRGDTHGYRHPVKIEGSSLISASRNGLSTQEDSAASEPFAGRLAKLARGAAVHVNSSHHQSIRRPGRGLRVAAVAPDGVIEAIEWVGGPEWIVGVQWHPERMRPAAGESANGQPLDEGNALASALFGKLVAEAAAAKKFRSRS